VLIIGKSMQKNNIVLNTRKELGFTQAEFAQALGVSLGYIFKLEKGEKPITQKICESIDRLISVKESINFDNNEGVNNQCPSCFLLNKKVKDQQDEIMFLREQLTGSQSINKNLSEMIQRIGVKS
jgi:transcriptional regulator with XRE-family HTH domain